MSSARMDNPMLADYLAPSLQVDLNATYVGR